MQVQRCRQVGAAAARTKRIVATEKSNMCTNILCALLSLPWPDKHPPSAHRGGFSIHRAVFAYWDAAGFSTVWAARCTVSLLSKSYVTLKTSAFPQNVIKRNQDVELTVFRTINPWIYS